MIEVVGADTQQRSRKSMKNKRQIDKVRTDGRMELNWNYKTIKNRNAGNTIHDLKRYIKIYFALQLKL